MPGPNDRATRPPHRSNTFQPTAMLGHTFSGSKSLDDLSISLHTDIEGVTVANYSGADLHVGNEGGTITATGFKVPNGKDVTFYGTAAELADVRIFFTASNRCEIMQLIAERER